MKYLNDIHEIKGKKFLVRVDFNVPIIDGEIRDSFRIEKAKETIDFIRSKGGQVLLMSHFEGEGGSLRPVAKYLESVYPVQFIDSYFPEKASLTSDLSTVIIFENTRKYPEEKSNDEKFSEHCASYADFYINEAFPASHREHATIVSIPKFIKSYAGITFVREVEELKKILSPEHPFVCILGGAKFDTKLPLIEKLFAKAETMCIGGALANDFLQSQGYSIGKSLVSSRTTGIEKFFQNKLIIPTDVIVDREGKSYVVHVSKIEQGDVVSDIGPETLQRIQQAVMHSRSVLWNGPLGNYEKGYTESTNKLATTIANSSVHSVVGGGDTIASIQELGLLHSFTFVSSGGGAMLDFLAHETLPGIQALEICN